MSSPKGKDNPTKLTLVADDPLDRKGELKDIGGSASDSWNHLLAIQAISSLWVKHSDPETREKQYSATVAALIGIRPRDELEGMIARAMLAEQTIEGRRDNLNHANKLSRSYAVLLEALNRHRGKGQQKVTVEHVHVHSGGQAIVGAVNGAGGGSAGKIRNQSHAKQIADAPLTALPGENAKKTHCQSPAMPNGRCRMHGGKSPGAPKGNRNAYKHGRYSAEAISQRRDLRALLSELDRLVDAVE